MINAMLRLRNYLNGIKLKNKLLISYIAFFFIPLCIFSLITFKSFSSILENNVIFSVEKNYNQTYSFLTEKFNKIKKTSDIILTDDYVNNMFIASNIYSDADNYFAMTKAMNFLGSFEDEDIIRIVLFLYDNQNLESSYNFNNVDSIKNSKWFNLINSNNLNMLWCPGSYIRNGVPAGVKPGSTNLALVRRFYSPSNYSKTLGYYCIYFHSKPIENIVNMGDAVNGSVTFLQNSNGDMIYASNKKQYSNLYKDFEKRTQEVNLSPLLKTCKANGKTLIYAQKNFTNSDWSLVTIISYDDILSQVRLTQERIAIFSILISIFCFAFAWMMARSLTKRIMQLQKKMKLAQQGNFSQLGNNSYTDEIGYLTNTYDFMLEQIKKLMDERYKAGIQVKAAELKALQEQINPHFLYNTLDTINWLAQKGSNEEVEKAISSLAQFYRLSLSNGNDEIPIHDELERISTYVQIQNIRFSSGINLVIDIDEEIGNYLILKLILQPFVENSILHGIMHKSSKEGFIIIGALIEDGNIRISLHDNGIGIPENILTKLNEENCESMNWGYGIKNVKKRILLNYGDQYGIKFKSSPRDGTTVEIVIPARYDEP